MVRFEDDHFINLYEEWTSNQNDYKKLYEIYKKYSLDKTLVSFAIEYLSFKYIEIFKESQLNQLNQFTIQIFNVEVRQIATYLSKEDAAIVKKQQLKNRLSKFEPTTHLASQADVFSGYTNNFNLTKKR
jgi:hypothetical protein